MNNLFFVECKILYRCSDRLYGREQNQLGNLRPRRNSNSGHSVAAIIYIITNEICGFTNPRGDFNFH